MPRPRLDELSGRDFDVAIIGAGIVGCSAARHLAAAGYGVLVVDRRDFASGATGRSSRFLPNGLRYLSLGGSVRSLLSRPRELITALRMARQAMRARSQFVRRSRQYVRPLIMAYPLYEGGHYSASQLRLAFSLLRLLEPRGESLEYRRLSRKEALETPLVGGLASAENLAGAAVFREYQIDWPERVALDALMEAQRLGAVARNYTPVVGIDREDDRGWRLRLADARGPGNASVAVAARLVLNTSGPWVDLVNQTSTASSPRQLVAWTKGSHILVQLPASCREWGLAALAADGRPLSITPWRGMHFIGPTETPFEDDPDDVRVTEEDAGWLLDQAARILPGARLRRADVLGGWAGIRPLTWSDALQAPRRDCVIHDLADEGLPGVLAVTGAPLATHELTAAALVRTVAERLPGLTRGGGDPRSPAAGSADQALSAARVQQGVVEEQAQTLEDLLLRRTGLGWNAGMAIDAAPLAATWMGEALGWDPQRVEQEIEAYRDEVQRSYLAASRSG